MRRARPPKSDLSRKFFQDTEIRCRNPECPKRGRFQHHVVYRQEVRRRYGNEWDARNALSLCKECHDRQHDGTSWKIKAAWLRDSNIEFAFELLGAYAVHYLSARYDLSEGDPRIERALADTLEA